MEQCAAMTDVEVAHLSLDHAQGVREARPIGVESLLPGGLRHELMYREVRQQQAPQFLLYKFRRLATQHRAGPAHVGLELIEDALDLPALVGTAPPAPVRAPLRDQGCWR